MGSLLLIFVYLIPTEPIEGHVANSASLFEREGSYPSFQTGFPLTSTRDNYTDAWMLLEASYNDSSIKNAFLNYRYSIDYSDPVETIVQHYTYDKAFDDTIMYGRYWNGYLVYLKPLLFLLNYSSIRYVLIAFQIILSGIILFLFIREKKAAYIIPYIISVLMIMPFAIVLNIQQSTCYSLFNIGIIMVLLFSKVSEKILYVFLYLGIATAYFDLLSYPLVTFGVPAVFYFTLIEAETIKKSFSECLR